MSSVLCELLGYGIGAVEVFWYVAPSLGFVLLRKYLKVEGSVVSVMQQVEQILDVSRTWQSGPGREADHSTPLVS
jgi:hypothetical protein